MSKRPPCRRCGCPFESHLHLRPGIDCGHCGLEVCESYQPPRLIATFRQWLDRRREEAS